MRRFLVKFTFEGSFAFEIDRGIVELLGDLGIFFHKALSRS